MRKAVAVHFRDANGKQFGHVTEAHSVFDGARKALAWFRGPRWYGSRPTDETILDISLVAESQHWRVRVETVENGMKEQTQLFERSPNAIDPSR